MHIRKNSVPFFQWLLDGKLIDSGDLLSTQDGFSMLRKSLSCILLAGGIDTVPDREDNILECGNYFDDWFLFAVQNQGKCVYGLVKMREQEYDQERGIRADGDTPGVTVSFVGFETDVMKTCLEEPSADHRKQLCLEINRVVAYPKQNHDPVLKSYFIRPEAQEPYLIAERYVHYIASFCVAGRLPVPEAYRQILRKRGKSARYARIPDFLEQNNRDAGKLVCDHEHIWIPNEKQLSRYEKLAILATHTGNVSVHSFAAEVRYHALFLTKWAKIRIPLIGSPYASAVRADMSIGDKEFQGPAPYYDLTSGMVRRQMELHGEAL